MKTVFVISAITITLMIFESCEMPVPRDYKDAVIYTKDTKSNAPQPDSTIIVMTWNIRLGIGRIPWLLDGCGSRVVFTEEEILDGLNNLTERINLLRPDVLLLQEVHINSKCAAYVDELRWIMDNTYFNYAVYGSSWKVQFVPSDGIGKVDECNAILSRWPVTDAGRIQLELINDQGSLTRYFSDRSCIIKAKIEIPGFSSFWAVNTHTAAFATDETKHLQLITFKDELDAITESGERFVAGGDLNTIPPGSDSTDYCIEDKCPDESFHQPGDNPLHKEGSNYTPESMWLVPLYSAYKCAVPLDVYQADQRSYFTHTTSPSGFWDRTLDYLFTNYRWHAGSVETHQEFLFDSDHAPVSAEFVLEKKQGQF
ncbi:MAG: endonuclease/exonuclease/phosphatase family protein [Bacteroidales bacterium]